MDSINIEEYNIERILLEGDRLNLYLTSTKKIKKVIILKGVIGLNLNFAASSMNLNTMNIIKIASSYVFNLAITLKSEEYKNYWDVIFLGQDNITVIARFGAKGVIIDGNEL